jgi:MFS family permease
LFEPALRKPLVIGLALAVLQQVTGINTILYYGSIIFTEQVGTQSTSAALWANVIIGAVNGILTVVALLIIDRIGRKSLLMLASGGMGLSLAALGLVFFVQPSAAGLVLALTLCYVAFFAVGMGPGVWVVLSELFPTRIRARAMAVATVTLWGACMLISLTFLSLVKAIGASGAFWIYAAMCFVTFVFLGRVVPETKGKTLEDIERGWGH